MNELAQYINESYDWVKLVSREKPPLCHDITLISYKREELKKNNGYDMFISCKASFNDINMDVAEKTKVSDMFRQMAKDDFSVFEENANKTYQVYDEYFDFCSKYKTLTKKLSNKELLIIFNEYVDQTCKVNAYLSFIAILDHVLGTFLTEALKNAGVNDFQYEWIVSKPLAFVKERDSIINIKKAKENGEDIEPLIEKHLEDFSWLGTHFLLGEPLTRDDVMAYMAYLKVDIEDLEQKRSNDVQELERIKSRSPALRQILDMAQVYAHMRTYRIERKTEADFVFRPIFNEIARVIGISYSDFLYLLVDEIVALLKGEADIEELKTKIEKRKAYYVQFLVNDDEIYTFEGEDSRLGSDDENLPAKDRLVKGLVAYQGRVQGRVKIVHCKEDIGKVEEGDIIVSTMTCPEMMVGIVKCAAIVTNEGGISSHAALISRELKIPCVLGSKNATKLWKDGEVVYVEAMRDEGGMSCHAAIISREFGIPCVMGTGIATDVLQDGDMVEVVAEGEIGEIKHITD